MEKRFIITGRNKIFIKRRGTECSLPNEGDIVLSNGAEVFSFGNYRAASIGDLAASPEGLVEMGLRESYGVLTEEEYAAAVKGAELVNWSGETRFCPCCGARLLRATEISKRCPECGREYFPQLSPAIVVLVKRGEEALLVHARNFRRPEMMALVAGFVETGESLEQCVAREIKEETDLEVKDIRYVGSQSWPFPHQLMLGFTATYAGGELEFTDGELSAGGFFTRDNVPELPTLPSLSRQIIDSWLAGES